MQNSTLARWLASLVVATSAGLAVAQQPDPEVDVRKIMDRLVAEDKYPLNYDAKRAKAAFAESLKWYRSGSVDVFDQGPGAKAKWAAKARAALEQYCRQLVLQDLGGRIAPGQPERTRQLAQEAVGAGCDDPLVKYLAALETVRNARGDVALLREHRDVVRALDASKYGDCFKSLATHYWLIAAQELPAKSELRKDENKWELKFWTMFERLAGSPDPAATGLTLNLAEQREGWAAEPGRTRRQNFEVVAKHLEAAKAPKSARLVAEAGFLRREAWGARGGAVAIPAEAERAFKEQMADVKEKLEQAWAADNGRHYAAAALVAVCRELRLPRAELEKWFARAMEVNPHCRVACLSKMEALSPQWGGVHEHLIAFVWMCARSENVEGMIPFVPLDYHLARNHLSGPRFEAAGAAIKDFYSRPVAWVQLSTALDALLGAEPDNMYLRSIYARLAGVANRPAAAVPHFEKLAGRYEPRLFPSKAEYDRCADGAKAAAGLAARLVGQWVEKGGKVSEFNADRTFKLAHALNGKESVTVGRYYVVRPDQIILALESGKEIPFTVVKSTADHLELKNAASEALELTRTKK